jgi:hypothetical protein
MLNRVSRHAKSARCTRSEEAVKNAAMRYITTLWARAVGTHNASGNDKGGIVQHWTAAIRQQIQKEKLDGGEYCSIRLLSGC